MQSMKKDEMDADVEPEPGATGDSWATSTDLLHLDVWIARHSEPSDADASATPAAASPSTTDPAATTAKHDDREAQR